MFFIMLKKKKDNKLWTLFLFYDGFLIKKVKINEDEKITNKVLFITVYGMKHLFGKNKVSLMVRPIRLLKTEEEKKRTYWGVGFEKGVDVE